MSFPIIRHFEKRVYLAYRNIRKNGRCHWLMGDNITTTDPKVWKTIPIVVNWSLVETGTPANMPPPQKSSALDFEKERGRFLRRARSTFGEARHTVFYQQIYVLLVKEEEPQKKKKEYETEPERETTFFISLH